MKSNYKILIVMMLVTFLITLLGISVGAQTNQSGFTLKHQNSPSRSNNITLKGVLQTAGIDAEKHFKKCISRRQRMAAFTMWRESLGKLEIEAAKISVSDGSVFNEKTPQNFNEEAKLLEQKKEVVLLHLTWLKQQLIQDSVPPQILQRLENVRNRFQGHSQQVIVDTQHTQKLINQVLTGEGKKRKKKYQELKTNLLKLKKTLNETSFKRTSAPISSQTSLPFTNTADDSDLPENQDQMVSPAPPDTATDLLYQPVPEDSVNVEETMSTAELENIVMELAQSPKAIYEYVRNNIQPEFYYGLLKGARETLLQQRGNDLDQAALLIALYRFAGIPAHYAQGRITLSIEQLMVWTGVDDPFSALRTVLDTGYAPNPIYQDGQLAAVSLNHVWVEAYVPYLDYRGLGSYAEGKDWISLSPSFKAIDRVGGMDIYVELDPAPSSWVDDYLTLDPIDNEISPLAYYREQIEIYLANNYPDVVYQDILSDTTIQAEDLGILPSSLPFSVDYVLNRFSNVPESLCHQVTITIGDELSPSLDLTLLSYYLLGHRLTIQYEPASIIDLAAVQAAGSLYLTDPFLIEVVPVVRLDGRVIDAGLIPIGMAMPDTFSLTFTTPTDTYQVSDTIISGIYQAVSFSSGNVPLDDLNIMPNDPEFTIGDLLHRTALRYLHLSYNHAREIADFCAVNSNVKTLSAVRCQTRLKIDTFDEIPIALDWQALDFDVELQPYDIISQNGGMHREKDHQDLAGHEWSYLEEFAFCDEEWFGIPAISTVSAIRQAHAQNIDIFTISLSDPASLTLIDDLLVPPHVIASVSDAVYAGYTVTVPKQTLTHHDWTGVGWLVSDPNTGSLGAMLAGDLAAAHFSYTLMQLLVLVDNQGLPTFYWMEVFFDAVDAYFRDYLFQNPHQIAPYEAAGINKISRYNGRIQRERIHDFQYYEGLDCFLNNQWGGMWVYRLRTTDPEDLDKFGYYYHYPDQIEEGYPDYFIAKVDYFNIINGAFIYTLGADPNAPLPQRMYYNIRLIDDENNVLSPGTYEFSPQDYFQIVYDEGDPLFYEHKPWFVIFEITITEAPEVIMPPALYTTTHDRISFKIDPAKVINRDGQLINFDIEKIALVIYDRDDNEVFRVEKGELEHIAGTAEYAYQWDRTDAGGQPLDIQKAPYSLRVECRKAAKYGGYKYYSNEWRIEAYTGLRFLSPAAGSEYYLGHLENGIYGIPMLTRAILLHENGTLEPLSADDIEWSISPTQLYLGPTVDHGQGLLSNHFVPFLDQEHTLTVSFNASGGGLEPLSDTITIDVTKPEFDFIAVSNGQKGPTEQSYAPLVTFEVLCSPNGFINLESLSLAGTPVLMVDDQEVGAEPLPLIPGVHCAIFGQIAGWLPEQPYGSDYQDIIILTHPLVFTGQVTLCSEDQNCDPSSIDINNDFELSVEYAPNLYTFAGYGLANVYLATPVYESPLDFEEETLPEPALQQASNFPYETWIGRHDDKYDIFKMDYLAPTDGELFTYRPPREKNQTEEAYYQGLADEQFPYTMQFRMTYYSHTIPPENIIDATFPYEVVNIGEIKSPLYADWCADKYALVLDDPEMYPPGSYLFFPQSNDLWRYYRQSIVDDNNTDNDLPDPTRLVYVYQIKFDENTPQAFSPGKVWTGPLPDGKDAVKLDRILPVRVKLLPEFVSDRHGVKQPFVLQNVEVKIVDENETVLWQKDETINLIGGQWYEYEWDGTDQNGDYLTPEDGPVTVVFSKDINKQHPEDGRARTITLETKHEVKILPPFELPYQTKSAQTLINGVNVANGNLNWQYNLYALRNQGLDLPFDLTFNSWSINDSSGPLGAKVWPDFDTRLQYIYGKDDDNNIHRFVRIYGLVNMTFHQDEAGQLKAELGQTGSLTFDGETWQLHDKYQTKYTFVPDEKRDIANLTEIADLNNNTITYKYSDPEDPEIRLAPLTTITANLVTARLSYDDDRPIKRITELKLDPGDPNTQAKVWSFSYQGKYLDTLTRPDESSINLSISDTTFSFLNGRGEQTIYALDEVDPENEEIRLVSSITEPESALTQFDYYTSSTTVFDPRGKAWNYEYNDLGNVELIKSPLDFETTMEWENMRMTALTDARGERTEYTHDNNGNVTRENFTVNAQQVKNTAVYSIANLPTNMTDTLGNLEIFSYDSEIPTNLISRKIDGFGEVDSFSFRYDSHGNPVEMKNALGNKKNMSYNGGFPVHANVENNYNNNNVYDAFGNLLENKQMVDGVEVIHHHYYDALDRLTEIKRDGWTIGHYFYDEEGNRIEAHDPDGKSTYTVFDGQNRVTKTTIENDTLADDEPLAELIVTTTDYDENGNIKIETDPRNIVTEYDYDDDNRRIEVNRAGITTDTYEYDGNGNVVLHKDGRDNPTQFEYDELNRQTKITYADGGITEKRYDGEGNLVWEKTVLGVINEYAYDKAKRLTKHTRTCDENGTGTVQPRERHLTYDAAGNLKTEEDFKGNLTQYDYDNAGRLITVTDALDNTITHTYDDQGNKIETIDQKGRKIEYEYNNQKMVTRVKRYVTMTIEGNPVLVEAVTQHFYNEKGNRIRTIDPLGKETRFKYNTVNELVKKTDHDNYTEFFEHDIAGNLIKQVDKNGSVTLNNYDPFNRLLKKEILPGGTFSGFSEEYTYDNAGNMISSKDSEGYATTYAYDNRNRVHTTTDPYGYTIVTTCDFAGNVTYRKDKNNKDREYTYDPRGLLNKETDHFGHSVLFAYDPVGNLTTRIDKKRYQELYNYDALNRRTEEFRYDSGLGGMLKIKTTAYDPVGNVRTVTNARGFTTTYIYNQLDNPVEVIPPDVEATVVNTYDLAGNVIASKDGDNHLTTYHYDNLHRQIKVTVRANPNAPDPVNDLVTQFQYDPVGNKIKVTPPKNETATSYVYDRMNRLLQVTSPEGLVTNYTYDRNGNLASQDFGGLATTFDYDMLNRRTKMTNAAGGLTATTYDPNGNIHTITQPNGDLQINTYDALNRLIETTYTPGQTVTDTYVDRIDYTYDDNNNPEMEKTYSSNGTTKTTTTTFDSFNRPRTVTIDGKLIEKTYDSNGNLKTECSPDGKMTAYDYNSMDRIEHVTAPEGVTSYTYTNNGRQLTVTKPDKSVTTYAYDFADRVEFLETVNQETPIVHFDYTYDKNGNRLTQNAKFGSGPSQITTYEYDNQDRLKSFTEGNITVNYTLDPQGNRTAKQTTQNGTTEDLLYHYDTQKRLTQVQDLNEPANNINFTYDDNGSMISRITSDGTETYVHSPRKQPLSVARNGQKLETYEYDHLGMRIIKNNLENNTTTGYVYDGRRILEETDANDQAMRSYRYGNNMLGFVASGLPQFTHHDPLGSIAAVTNADGTILETRDYQPFGQSDITQNSDTDLPNVELHFDGELAPEVLGDLFSSEIPTTRTLEIPSPDDPDLVEGDTWHPDIYLTIGTEVPYVTVPVTQIPITMVNDLSPPYLTMTVSEKYLDPTDVIDELNYTIDIDLGDPIQPLTNASVSVQLPTNLSITNSSHTFTDQYNLITWALGDITQQITQITFTASVNFTQNPNIIITPHAELYAVELTDQILSNQTPTAILSEGIAFFTEAYVQGTNTPTAYAKLYDSFYSTDFRCTVIYHGEVSQNARGFIQKELDQSTGMMDFGARFYDPTIGRFTTHDPYRGDISEPRSLLRYSYAFNNPLEYFDVHGFYTLRYTSSKGFVEEITSDDIELYPELALQIGSYSKTGFRVEFEVGDVEDARAFLNDIFSGKIADSWHLHRLFMNTGVQVGGKRSPYMSPMALANSKGEYEVNQYYNKSLSQAYIKYQYDIQRGDVSWFDARYAGITAPAAAYLERKGLSFIPAPIQQILRSEATEGFVATNHEMDAVFAFCALAELSAGTLGGLIKDPFAYKQLMDDAAKAGFQEVKNIGPLESAFDRAGRTIATKSTAGHHTVPKYMGGRENQTLADLAKDIHDPYHDFLDNWKLPPDIEPRFGAPKSFRGEVRHFGRENKGLEIFAKESRANREFIVDNLRESYKQYGIYDEVTEVFEHEAKIFIRGITK
ncbi:RHS repeat-associated core domain-containing protein [candidate division CSSED10-310 bacterium]|uniref:RHS repeat-associated core domain-containing protein n=1 Tax=candidate division CSSED10-310 bacterium TaxID=2855610 RepID=A0ABV6YSL7_UNCC1